MFEAIWGGGGRLQNDGKTLECMQCTLAKLVAFPCMRDSIQGEKTNKREQPIRHMPPEAINLDKLRGWEPGLVSAFSFPIYTQFCTPYTHPQYQTKGTPVSIDNRSITSHVGSKIKNALKATQNIASGIWFPQHRTTLK